jgi:hypothetical protein
LFETCTWIGDHLSGECKIKKGTCEGIYNNPNDSTGHSTNCNKIETLYDASTCTNATQFGCEWVPADTVCKLVTAENQAMNSDGISEETLEDIDNFSGLQPLPDKYCFSNLNYNLKKDIILYLNSLWSTERDKLQEQFFPDEQEISVNSTDVHNLLDDENSIVSESAWIKLLNDYWVIYFNDYPNWLFLNRDSTKMSPEQIISLYSNECRSFRIFEEKCGEKTEPECSSGGSCKWDDESPDGDKCVPSDDTMDLIWSTPSSGTEDEEDETNQEDGLFNTCHSLTNNGPDACKNNEKCIWDLSGKGCCLGEEYTSTNENRCV